MDPISVHVKSTSQNSFLILLFVIRNVNNFFTTHSFSNALSFLFNIYTVSLFFFMSSSSIFMLPLPPPLLRLVLVALVAVERWDRECSDCLEIFADCRLIPASGLTLELPDELEAPSWLLVLGWSENKWKCFLLLILENMCKKNNG